MPGYLRALPPPPALGNRIGFGNKNSGRHVMLFDCHVIKTFNHGIETYLPLTSQ